jgi:hypothetical protein
MMFNLQQDFKSGQGAQAVPITVGQRLGLHKPQLQSAGQELWSATGVHHPLQPRAKRHGGAGDPHTQRPMCASSSIRDLATRQPSHRRRDWVLQPPAASPGPEDEDPSQNLRNVQISRMTCAETDGLIHGVSAVSGMKIGKFKLSVVLEYRVKTNKVSRDIK